MSAVAQWIARAIVWLSAPLVPRALRPRWREEWLGEIETDAGSRFLSQNASDKLRDCNNLERADSGKNRRPASVLLARVAGAPIDALLLRVGGWSGDALWFGWLADGRDALRSLRKAPLQTTTIVTCLAVGSTLTVLVFGVINAMLGGRLPGVVDRGRLVRVRVERASDHRVSAPRVGDFHILPASTAAISGFAAEISAKAFSVSAGGDGGNADGAFVSGSYFQVLGTHPVAGRLLTPSDDRADSAPVAVIGYHFWQRRFGGSAAAIGSIIQITTIPFEVVGVAPAGLTGLSAGDPSRITTTRRDIWMPASQATRVGDGVVGRADNSAEVIARLGHGVSASLAETELQAVLPQINGARRSAATRPDPRGDTIVSAIRFAPFHLLFADDDEPLANALLIAALASVPLVVLGIACANVAGVQLARAIGRTHELAIRVSLGAHRSRIVRLLAIETGLLAVVAATAGWLVARELLRLSAAVLPIAPIADARLLLIAIILPLGVTLAAGIVPAWRATGFDVLSGLRLGPRVGRAASPRLRRLVVAGQMGLSIALLIGAGTLIRGLDGLPGAIGPAHEDVLIAEVQQWDLGWDAVREQAGRQAIVDRLRDLPGVEALGLSPRSIFNGPGRGGDGMCRARDAEGLMRLATPEYFDVLRLRLRQGRAFRSGEDGAVAVINETFARRLRDPAAAIGASLGVSGRRTATVVGVVADNYERFPTGQPRALCYVPWTSAAPNTGSGNGYLSLFVQSRRAADLAPTIRSILREIDPRLGPIEMGTMPELMRSHYRVLHGLTNVLALASTVAFGMAALGLFGIVAYGAAQRTHEFGVRLALGARPTDIGRSLVRESLMVVLAGAIVGLALAAPATWLLSQGLASARVADPMIGIVALTVLVAVSLAAAIKPMRRASRIDPVAALRSE